MSVLLVCLLAAESNQNWGVGQDELTKTHLSIKIFENELKPQKYFYWKKTQQSN
jgi:hypothetical protein